MVVNHTEICEQNRPAFLIGVVVVVVLVVVVVGVVVVVSGSFSKIDLKSHSLSNCNASDMVLLMLKNRVSNS